VPFEIKMPQLGLTMETGTVLNWLVGVGDRFVPGQEIFEVEMDKAVVVVEVHEEGIIERILVPVGQQVPVGTVLAIAVAPGETLPAGWQPRRPSKVPAPASEPGIASASSLSRPSSTGELQASWKARVMARQASLELRTIAGSGPGGRVMAADVARALATSPAEISAPAKASPVAAQLATALGLDLSNVTGSGPQGRIVQTDVIAAAAAMIRGQATSRPTSMPGPAQVASTIPLTGIGGIVSERMAISAHTTARVTLFREVDTTALIDLRERFKTQGIEVSYSDFLVRICAIALREHPDANARMGDGQIERLGRVNIGFAVDTDRGLLVPVIRDADTLAIRQIAAESARLIGAARSGRSLPDDLTGGTFTITNLGMFGVEGFTPLINLPECCALGVGRIVRKPVVIDENDTVAVRPMLTLSLVFDHRVIDGAPAARFLDRIAQLIQDPLLLL
jgi:pyruvate dehydrogenase E2 component (dihydrolipoamide acetyltransferase)